MNFDGFNEKIHEIFMGIEWDVHGSSQCFFS